MRALFFEKGRIVKLRRKFIIIAVLLVIGVLVIGALNKKNSGGSQASTVVRIEHPHNGELIEFISAPGEIEPQTNVEISAKVAARIITLPFDEGDHVTKGDPNADPPIPASVLVRLDDRDLKSRLRSAQANRDAQAAQIEVERARVTSQRETMSGIEAQLEQAERDLRRQQELLKSKDISQATYDQAKLEYDTLKARLAAENHTIRASRMNLQVMQYRLKAAEAEIEQADEALSNTIIRSPIDGIITRLNAEVGELVMTGTMNNAGTVILEVADLSRMLVVAQVGEADVGKLQVHQKATVSIQAFPDDTFTGQVDKIALTHRMSNNGTKYFRTEILLDADPNVAKLYSGLTAHVDIETLKHDNVLVLPSQAILGRPVDGLPLDIRENSPEVEKEKTFTPVVYRVVDGKTVVTPVKIGPSNLTHTIIAAGLSEDDKVVVGPYKVLDGLQHDQAVKDEAAEKKTEENDPNHPIDPNDPNAGTPGPDADPNDSNSP